MTVEDSFLVDCNQDSHSHFLKSDLFLFHPFTIVQSLFACLYSMFPHTHFVGLISLWMYKALALLSSAYSIVSLTSLKPCKSLKISLERTGSLCRVVSKDKGCFSVVQMNTVFVISLFFTQVCRFIIGVLLRGSS